MAFVFSAEWNSFKCNYTVTYAKGESSYGLYWSGKSSQQNLCYLT